MGKKKLTFSKYTFTADSRGTVIDRQYIDLKHKGDYGADPIGGGLFKLVPSGRVVDEAERDKVLKRR